MALAEFRGIFTEMATAARPEDASWRVWSGPVLHDMAKISDNAAAIKQTHNSQMYAYQLVNQHTS